MGSILLLAILGHATRKKEETEKDTKGKKKRSEGESIRVLVTRICWLVIRIRVSAQCRTSDWLGRTARFGSASHCARGENVA